MRNGKVSESFPFFCHTMAKDIPMRINNKVHAGPNTQFGGLKNGFSSVVYHVVMESVNRVPSAPMAMVVIIEMMYFVALFIEKR